MADLMKAAYTFDALKNKYGDFHVPLIKIKANGSDLVATLSIVEMKAVLSLDDASMVVFKIGGLYDEESHSFDKKVKNKFKLGEIMEVELGYLSSSVNIFKGYVAKLGAEFGDNPVLVVTLMDVRRLMMVSGNTYELHEVVTYSDAVRKIIGKYSKLCRPEMDDTNDHLEQPLSQTQDDYSFVAGELVQGGKVNREFFVLADKAYFRKPRKSTTPVMTLKYGRELLKLEVHQEYQDIKVEVIGYDGKKQEVIVGNANVTADRKQKKIFSSTPTYTRVEPAVDTKKKADTQAEAIADAKKWSTGSGRGVTIGLPELVPGRFVSVEALEPDYGDHKYYIKKVVHEITEDKFYTNFEIGGWT